MSAAVYAKKDESVEEAAARAIGIKLLGVIGKGVQGRWWRSRGAACSSSLDVNAKMVLPTCRYLRKRVPCPLRRADPGRQDHEFHRCKWAGKQVREEHGTMQT
jgi:hypothetical protein